MSVNDSLVNWGVAHELADASSAKLAIQGPNGPRPDDFARVGSYNEGLEQIADLMADSALWLDAEYSGGIPQAGVGGSEPRARNLGGGDRTGVSGAVIFGGAAVLPGIASNHLSLPDSAALDITGDIEIVMRLSLADWSAAGTQSIFSKRVPTQDAYAVQILSTGIVRFVRWVATAVIIYTPTAPPLVDGTSYWLKVAFDLNDGGVSRATYYYAADQPTEPSSWTQWDTVTNASVTATDSTTAPVYVGGGSSGTAEMPTGSIYRTIVRNGIDGTAVLDVDLTAVPNWAGSFTAATGQTVTLNTTAANYGAPSALDAKYGSVLGAYVYDGAAVLPGITANNLSVPDAANLDITGDISIMADATMNWHAATNQYPISKRNGSSGEWMLRTDGAAPGRINFIWFEGAVAKVAQSSVVVSAPAGSSVRWQVMATVDADNGAGSSSVTFYERPDSASAWTQLGTVQTAAGLRAATATTNAVAVGSETAAGTSGLAAMSVHRVMVQNSVTTTFSSPVLDVDLANGVADYATSFTASTGQTVTVNSTTSDTNDPLLLTHTGENYFVISNTNNNYVSVPDSADTRLGNEIELVARLGIEDWGNSVINASAIMSKWTGAGGTTAREWYFYGTYATRGLAFAYTDTAGATILLASPSLYPALSANTPQWVKMTFTYSGGMATGNFWYAPDQPSEPTADQWISLGSHSVAAASGGNPGSSRVELAGLFSGTTYNRKTGYRFIIRQSIGGPATVDVNCAADITDAGATSFTATSGQTVTVNRATSGRKTALVTRPVWLFGTDDYLEVADNALLDVANGEELSIFMVTRSWATALSFGSYISKRSSTASTPYWTVVNNATTTAKPFIEISDGTASTGAAGLGLTGSDGVVQGDYLQIDKATNFIGASKNNSAVGTVNATGVTGSLENGAPVRIGARGDSSPAAYQEFEVLAVAVFRRVLTADEIAAINNYYGTV